MKKLQIVLGVVLVLAGIMFLIAPLIVLLNVDKFFSYFFYYTKDYMAITMIGGLLIGFLGAFIVMDGYCSVMYGKHIRKAENDIRSYQSLPRD